MVCEEKRNRIGINLRKILAYLVQYYQIESKISGIQNQTRVISNAYI